MSLGRVKDFQLAQLPQQQPSVGTLLNYPFQGLFYNRDALWGPIQFSRGFGV